MPESDDNTLRAVKWACRRVVWRVLAVHFVSLLAATTEIRMKIKPALGLLLLALSLPTVALRTASAPAFVQDEAYTRALQAFREQRYPAAYGLFARLADAGHVPSARIALLMYDHSRSLFGNDWYASPDQQQRWNAMGVNSARHRPVVAEVEAGD